MKKTITEKLTFDAVMGGMLGLAGLGLLSEETNFDGKVAGLGLITLGIITARLQLTSGPIQKKD